MAQTIRIQLKAYDHNLVDQAAARIVEAATKVGAKISGQSQCQPKKRL